MANNTYFSISLRTHYYNNGILIDIVRKSGLPKVKKLHSIVETPYRV